MEYVKVWVGVKVLDIDVVSVLVSLVVIVFEIV